VTPLMAASFGKHEAVVVWFVKAGADTRAEAPGIEMGTGLQLYARVGSGDVWVPLPFPHHPSSRPSQCEVVTKKSICGS
jgi:hypothetical protein